MLNRGPGALKDLRAPWAPKRPLCLGPKGPPALKGPQVLSVSGPRPFTGPPSGPYCSPWEGQLHGSCTEFHNGGWHRVP